MDKRPRVLGFAQAAAFVGVSPQRFGRLVTQYRIPNQKIPNNRIFFEEDLTRFVQSHERQENLRAYNRRQHTHAKRRAAKRQTQ